MLSSLRTSCMTVAIGLALFVPTLHAQPGITRTAGYTPDGRNIASSSTSAIDIWDVASGRLVRQLEGHTDFVNALAVSPDGRRLASGSYDFTVRLWDIQTGKEIRRFKGPEKAVAFIALSPDGKSLAAGGYDKVIWVWDVASGNEIRRLEGSQGDILGLTFSADGKTLASNGCELVIRLWDLTTGKEVRQLVGNRHHIRTFAFAADGKTGVSGGCDHSIRVWDLGTGKEKRQLVGHSGDVFSVTFSPDGNTLASGSHDGSVRLWDLAEGAELRRCGDHVGGVIYVAFAPDGRTLTSGGYDKRQRIWETANGKERLTFGTVPPDQEAQPDLAGAEWEKNAWKDLASEDGRRAHRAIWGLTTSTSGVALIREHLKPLAPPPVDQTRALRLIEDLDHDVFKVREKAYSDLADMGRGIIPLLRKTLNARPGSEVRKRVEKLLFHLTDGAPSNELLRSIRAIETLENIGAKEAQAVLQTLVRDNADAEVGRQAAASLSRLTRRAAK
jgi:hypothetical protein